MNTFILNEDQTMIRDLARELAQAEVKTRSEVIDHTQSCPREAMGILAESGLVACAMPENYGGAELDYWSQVSVIEETAKECGSTAYVLAANAEAAEVLLKHGKEEVKLQYIPELVAGAVAAIAGSDSAPGTTFKTNVTAQKTDNGYVLNGVKKNVVNSKDADIYLVAAKCEEKLLWFAVESKNEGISVEEKPRKLGFKGCSYDDVVFKACQVSEESLLDGDVISTLEPLQALNMAAIAEGIAQGALQEAIQYVNQRVQFGKPIAQFENTQHVTAELLAKTEAARALVWDAVRVKDSGESYAYVAGLAKLVATDVAAVVTRKCVQLMGGYGYSREYPVERKMRDAKMTELAGGASNIQKSIIAKKAVVKA